MFKTNQNRSGACRLFWMMLAFTMIFFLPFGKQFGSAKAISQTVPKGSSDSQNSQMLDLARQCAALCDNAMEKWVTSGEITEEKLFSRLYFPIPNTDPPKFNTDYDRLADRDIQPIEEAFLVRSPDIVFVVLIDKNGYLPSHNLRFSQPLTGDPEKDLNNNRTKRIFCDRTGLQAAHNTSSYLLQSYQRDTGETILDLSVPLYLRSKHWGALRIAYRAAANE